MPAPKKLNPSGITRKGRSKDVVPDVMLGAAPKPPADGAALKPPAAKRPSTPAEPASKKPKGPSENEVGASDDDNADLVAQIATAKREALVLELQAIKAKNTRLAALGEDNEDLPQHVDDDDDDVDVGKTSSKTPLSLPRTRPSPFNTRRRTMVEEAAVVSDTLLHCDYAASCAALNAALFCEAVIHNVIMPNSASAIPESVVGLLKDMSDVTAPQSMRNTVNREVAIAMCRSFTPALVAKFLKDPRSPLDISVFLNINKGVFYSCEDMSGKDTPKFTSFSNESGSELLLIVSRWQSLVAVFDPTFGMAAAGLLRCCAELLQVPHTPQVVYQYVTLIRQNVSIGSMISDSMVTLFTVDQNVLTNARLLGKSVKQARNVAEEREKRPRDEEERPYRLREDRREDRRPLNRFNNRDDRRPQDQHYGQDDRDRQRDNTCRDWNESRACYKTPCRRDHKCSWCSSRFHTGPSCPERPERLERPVERQQLLLQAPPLAHKA